MAVLGVSSWQPIWQNVLFGSGTLECYSGRAIKQMCATNSCVADRQLFQYNLYDPVAAF